MLDTSIKNIRVTHTAILKGEAWQSCAAPRAGTFSRYTQTNTSGSTVGHRTGHTAPANGHSAAAFCEAEFEHLHTAKKRLDVYQKMRVEAFEGV